MAFLGNAPPSGLVSASLTSVGSWKLSPHAGNGQCIGFVPFRRVSCGGRGSVDVAEKWAKSESRVPRLIGKGCKLIGSGSAIPALEVSNVDLARIIETSDEWISVRTGIRKRRVLLGDESLTSLEVEAAKKALEMAKVKFDDIDLILMCSSTPDDLFGSGPQIQRALGCEHNPLAYDITAACSGFILGLASAACHIRDCYNHFCVTKVVPTLKPQEGDLTTFSSLERTLFLDLSIGPTEVPVSYSGMPRVQS